MERRKVFQVINTIVFFILMVFFGYFSIKLSIEAFSRDETPFYLGFVAMTYFLFSLTVFVFYIKSFRSVNLNKNFFKSSFILNSLTLLIIIFVFLIATYFLKGIWDGFRIMGLIYVVGLISLFIFLISMILFLIGYVKNKKKSN